MFRWADSDWLSSRIDRWVTHNQGYTKLRSRWLSKGCQTMLDRPSPRALWVRSDSEVLDSIPVQEHENGNEPAPSFSEKCVQYDQDIADYIAYLNKPIINMNDHFIEIHQYHYDSTNLPDLPPVRPPTRRKKHKIDLKKTEIVENKGMNTLKSPEYSEFLVKKSPVRNIRIVNGRSSDEENQVPQEMDQHRQLDQVANRSSHVTRGQTFSVGTKDQGSNNTREFLSFRTYKKNKSERRKKKKVVVSEAGINGPIWPAVLLTFDRSISPGPPAEESEV